MPTLDGSPSTYQRDVAASSGAYTFSHTCVGGNNSWLIVGAGWRGGNITGVKYNGVPLTVVVDVGSLNSAAMWELEDPTPGTHGVEITLSGVGGVKAYAASYTDCGGVRGSASHLSSGKVQTCDVVSEEDDIILDVGIKEQSYNAALAESAGQTPWYETWSTALTKRWYMGSWKAGAASSTTMSWTSTLTGNGALAALSLMPVDNNAGIFPFF